VLISIRDMQCVEVDGEGDILALCQVPGKGELGLGGRCLSKRGERVVVGAPSFLPVQLWGLERAGSWVGVNGGEPGATWWRIVAAGGG
jgi:hypothetical protein